MKNLLESNAKQLGVSPGLYTTSYDSMVKTGAKDAKGNALSKQDIANQLTTQMQQEVLTNRAQAEQSAQALAQHKADLQAGLMMQAQSAQYMAPYINNIMSAGVAQSKVLNSLADQMPDAYKGIFQAQAASTLNNAQQIGSAYAAQSALLPTMNVMNTYQQQQSQDLANQAAIYKAAAQMQSGGGGSSFAQLLAQQGAPTGP
jgi:hypothetical protein